MSYLVDQPCSPSPFYDEAEAVRALLTAQRPEWATEEVEARVAVVTRSFDTPV